MATETKLITAEELLAMPDDGVERWLIAGELRERPMTVRNRFHSSTMACMACELENWRRQQPEPRGRVYAGDAGVRLRTDPDTIFGIDVAYVSAETLAKQSGDSTIRNGVPTLAVEILSPNDVLEDVDEKLDEYLKAGVALVWLIHTRRRTVTVYSPGAEPVLFNAEQELTAEPHLPGFRVPVQRLFE